MVSKYSVLRHKFAWTACLYDVFREDHSRGTKVGDMLTLAPERYTAGLCMVTKVTPWCISNHRIADSIDLHNDTADDFLRKLARYM